MSLVVSVYNLTFGENADLVCEEEVIGPFREEDRAHAYADRLRRALVREGLDKKWGVHVDFLWPAGESARSMVETLAARE